MSFPAIADLVPQQGEMCLLDRVEDHAPQQTSCIVRVDDSALFADPSGNVPAWVGLEWMAQCIAVHGGLRARDAGLAPRAGLLLGTRRLSLRVEGFAAGSELLVRAAPRREADHGLVAFGCEVLEPGSDALVVEGQLNVFLFDPGELPPR